MIVKREDLLAAATAGVLHYGEIDSLLIFLAQREATVKKRNALTEKPETKKPEGWKHAHWLCYVGGVLAIGFAVLFGVLFSTRETGAFGLTAMLWFALAYALCAVGATAWFDLRGRRVPIGLFVALAIAMIPLVVFLLRRIM